MKAKYIRKARRMISGKGYWNMRLLNLQFLLRQLQTDFHTYSNELGGCENMNPDDYKWYKYHYSRIRRQIAYYERKCSEQR